VVCRAVVDGIPSPVFCVVVMRVGTGRRLIANSRRRPTVKAMAARAVEVRENASGSRSAKAIASRTPAATAMDTSRNAALTRIPNRPSKAEHAKPAPARSAKAICVTDTSLWVAAPSGPLKVGYLVAILAQPRSCYELRESEPTRADSQRGAGQSEGRNPPLGACGTFRSKCRPARRIRKQTTAPKSGNTRLWVPLLAAQTTMAAPMSAGIA